MTDVMDDAALRAAFAEMQTAYAEGVGKRWRENYAAHLDRVRTASREAWLTPEFQRRLWNDTNVSGIGAGSAVTVDGAFQDMELAEWLLGLRDAGLTGSTDERGAQLQGHYEALLARVHPRYASKRPRARCTRLLAALFPNDMTSLMDRHRIWQVETLIGARRVDGDFMAQHSAVRARLQDLLGLAQTTDAIVEQAVFPWFLWESQIFEREPGAVEVVGAGSVSTDLPELYLLPADAQRRSLFSVQNNVALLLTMVREAEDGIGKDDLIRVIMSEAPQLSASSAANVINQALGGSLGLLKFADGAYLPTKRGTEFLASTAPAQLLRMPLIGRVFGIAHLLSLLSKRPDGMLQKEATAAIQALVPTWTTPQPASFVVQWAKLTDLVQTAETTQGFRLSLTEDGQDYAAALPDNFEERWRIAAPAPIGELPQDDLPPDPAAEEASYGVAGIVAEGCFLPPEQIAAAVALLKRKKNLVLQGPPGTGKTWLAKRLGYALIGAKDPARVTAVQFQPSFSYEDFVRGLRPDADRRLALVDGLFLKVAAQAQARPKEDFVLVIEEINRGDPAQIFGELLTLLEASKRKPEEALRLTYPAFEAETFHIPPNLHVIGTMNLADRSLALVDLALRRRFAFLTLKPELGPLWRGWCEARGAPTDLLDAIAARMGTLNAAIGGDRRLGEQFRIGHSFATPPDDLRDAAAPKWSEWWREVVETEIAPLLTEYWYEEPELARDHAGRLADV